MRFFMMAALAAVQLVLAPGCSQASVPAGSGDGDPPVKSVSTRAAAARTAASPAPQTASRVLGKRDFILRGKPACEIRFVYAGRDAEDLFWEEPCQAVTAKMMGRPELQALDRWDRLDSYAQKFVTALPGGKVLYVEGSFSASVYPIGTTGSTYEVSVAD